jgi:hypothetical protein
MGVEIGVRNLMGGGEVYGLDRVTFRSSNMLGLPMPATVHFHVPVVHVCLV